MCSNIALCQVGETVGIIVNGGFKEGYSAEISYGREDNSRWADLDVSYMRKLSKERKGFVHEINCNRFNHGVVQFVQAGVSIRGVDVYKISFWAKSHIQAPLEVLFRKYGKPHTTYYSKAFKLTGEW